MGRRRWLPLLAFDPGAIARLMSSPPHPIPLAPMGAGARRVREVQPATRLLHHHYRRQEHARRPEQHLLAAGGQRGDSGGAAGSGDGGRCLLVSTSGDGRGGGGAQGTAPAARHSSQYFRNTTVEWITARVCISRHFYHPRVGPILPGWVGGRRANKPFGCRPSKLWLSAISPAGPTGITPSEAPVCTCDKRATRGGWGGCKGSKRAGAGAPPWKPTQETQPFMLGIMTPWQEEQFRKFGGVQSPGHPQPAAAPQPSSTSLTPAL